MNVFRKLLNIIIYALNTLQLFLLFFSQLFKRKHLHNMTRERVNTIGAV